jgi:hypothetical protein
MSESQWRIADEKSKGGSLLTDRASGSITNDQRSSMSCLKALRLMARLALMAAYSRGKRSCSNHERANDTGLASCPSRRYGAPSP